jgi:hypothetical protein
MGNGEAGRSYSGVLWQMRANKAHFKRIIVMGSESFALSAYATSFISFCHFMAASIWAITTFGGSGPALTAHGSLDLKQEIQIQSQVECNAFQVIIMYLQRCGLYVFVVVVIVVVVVVFVVFVAVVFSMLLITVVII